MRFFLAIGDSLVKMRRESWKLKIFLRGNHSILFFKTQGTHSYERKEMIPHFPLIFTIFFGVPARISGALSVYRHFSPQWLERLG